MSAATPHFGYLKIKLRRTNHVAMTTPVLSETLTTPIVNFITSLRSKLGRTSPLVVGLSGPQGSGKTTLVNDLVERLSSPPNSFRVVAFSIDDIYLGHEDLFALATANPTNKLLQHRGEPGTHDVTLGLRTLESLIAGNETPIPSYDKSKYNGQGDRVPPAKWTVAQPPFDVILFEGWCVGFQSLPTSVVAETRSKSSYPGTLLSHPLPHLDYVNEKLRSYSSLWSKFGCLVWLNARDIKYVYAWREQQEQAMRTAKGRGMSAEQVKGFVDGYMPAYEMYLAGLMRGEVFSTGEGKELLRIDYGEMREVVGVQSGKVEAGEIHWRDY
jgi:D-glycerate 3-kinase